MNKLIICASLLVLVSCGTATEKPSPMELPITFDWQGHRGARGLLPENSIPAFRKALEYPFVRTLELDVAVSADSQIVVSHEPWFNPVICRGPEGEVLAEASKINLHQLDYAAIKAYDCGSWGHERFPEQRAVAVYKPLLSEVIESADAFARELGRELPRYNIEIKSEPAYDGVFAPPPPEFVALVRAEIDRAGVGDRSTVQSFDARIIRELHRQDPGLAIAYLDEHPGGLTQKLADLGFVPAIYSPYYPTLSANIVRECHERGMRVIPWTVNDTAAMRGMIELGVDGIITDYPDRAARFYADPDIDATEK